MIVPEYWAEASDRFRGEHDDGRKFNRVVKRFGWSDISREDAQRHANERLAAAIEDLRRKEEVEFVEPRVAYNGADGLPIREQIIDRNGDAVVTRNAYGALCLNTPNVLFADVDIIHKSGCGIYVGTFAVIAVGLLAASIAMDIPNPFFLVVLLAMLSAAIVGSVIDIVARRISGSPKDIARRRIESVAKSHPDWSLRLYETPMGYRVLVTHATFDPRGQETLAFFDQILADPIYVRMCFNQNCFRARVSPKPWRVGIKNHLKPRPGVWPIAPDRMAEREAWVAKYERASQNHSACRYITTLGNGRACTEALTVQRWHDQLSAADRAWPIA